MRDQGEGADWLRPLDDGFGLGWRGEILNGGEVFGSGGWSSGRIKLLDGIKGLVGHVGRSYADP